MRCLHLTSSANKKAAIQSAQDLKKGAGHAGSTVSQWTTRNAQGECKEGQRGLGDKSAHIELGEWSWPRLRLRSPGVRSSPGTQHCSNARNPECSGEDLKLASCSSLYPFKFITMSVDISVLEVECLLMNKSSWEVAESTKRLLCEHRDRSSYPQCSCKKLGMVACICNTVLTAGNRWVPGLAGLMNDVQ